MDVNGNVKEQHWFDVARLKVISDQPVMEQPNFKNGPQAEGKQGAAEKPKFMKV